MYTTSILAVATAIVGLSSAQTTSEPITGIRGNASTVSNNPVGLVYTATLPAVGFSNPTDPRGNVKGSISATANPGGVGVTFTINISNLPTSGGPFLYHLHDAPVPANGNCTQTLAHLDPYIRGETPVCNKALPETCQVGDLSGKYGDIASDPFVQTYKDNYAATVAGLGASFGNRSIVIHFANKTRITCANFTLASNGTGSGTGSPSRPTPIPFTGDAAPRLAAFSGLALAAVGAFAFLL